MKRPLRDAHRSFPDARVETIIDKSHRSFTSLKSKAAPATKEVIDHAATSSSACCFDVAVSPSSASSLGQGIVAKLPEAKSGVKRAAKKRRDQPPVYSHRRGDKQAALQIAGDRAALEEAERHYREDWLSSGDTSSYNVITWIELHNAYGLTMEKYNWSVLPLTPAKIHGVGTLLKAGGFRSSKNYMHAIKVLHVGSGYEWNEGLALARSRFMASTMRGMGPGRQSEPLDFSAAVALDYGDAPIIDGGPYGTHAVIVLSTFFLLRELEASTAMRINVRLNMTAMTVTMRLPASKRDPHALGVERTWGCICSAPKAPQRECPFHAAKHQHELLNSIFGEMAVDDDLPFFPGAGGRTLSGEDMLRLIEEIATRLNEVLFLDSGVRRFGKHSWRATGAVFLALIGIEVYKIAMLARWLCGVVTHYTRIAPLKTITDDFKRRHQCKSITPPMMDDLEKQLKVIVTKTLKHGNPHRKLATHESKIKAIMDANAVKYDELKTELEEKIKQAEKRCAPRRFCVNRKTGCVHKVLSAFEEAGPDAITYCGWKYAHASIKMVTEPTEDGKDVCPTCLPELKARKPRGPASTK